jgi:hypothetical protein
VPGDSGRVEVVTKDADVWLVKRDERCESASRECSRAVEDVSLEDVAKTGPGRCEQCLPDAREEIGEQRRRVVRAQPLLEARIQRASLGERSLELELDSRHFLGEERPRGSRSRAPRLLQRCRRRSVVLRRWLTESAPPKPRWSHGRYWRSSAAR